jgi:MFS family permease
LGFSLTRSALWISSTVAGGALGMYLFGQLADRIGRKPRFIAFQAGVMSRALVSCASSGCDINGVLRR